MVTRIYLNVRILRLQDALQLGWLPTDAYRGCVPHGLYAVLCIWLCACPAPRLRPEGEVA